MSWTKMKLGDAATFINGYPFKPTDWKTEGKEIIRIQNLTGRGNDVNYFDGEIPEKYKVRKGDLLISWSATLGIFEWDREDAWLNQHIFKVVFNKIEFDKSFFKHLISTVLLEFGHKVHGSTMKHITKVNFDKTIISLPSLPKQKRIAEILDKADALRQKNKQLLVAYDELLQATFLDMFGEPMTNAKNWKKERLDRIAKLERGRFSPRPRNDPSYFIGPYPFIQTGDISRSGNKLDTYTQTLNEKGIKVSKQFKKGTIVIAIVGATIGATSILDIDVYATDSVIGISTNQKLANNVFLEFVMQFWKPILLKIAPEAARANINLEILGRLDIIIPPIAIQNQFAQILENIETQKALVKQSLQESENLFNGLVQKAFGGEL